MSETLAQVLDASALLAYLYGEDGAETVRNSLAVGCCISVVNWSEVLSKVADAGDSPQDLVAQLEESRLFGTSLRIEKFTEVEAMTVAELRSETKHLGLSLGDRACLALGRRLGAKVLTADRDWKNLGSESGPGIQLIR